MGDVAKLSEQARTLWRCPVCHSNLLIVDGEVVCQSVVCGSRFPVVARVPILLDESKSLFSIADFLGPEAGSPRLLSGLQRTARRPLRLKRPNRVSAQNYDRLGRLLLARQPTARVLVVGGSVLGQGMDAIASMNGIELIESDVAFGPRTQIVCDAHDLPFRDRSLDAVVIQAVLEHVVDPYRCVAEIHRVLKDDGMVYAETPFMQQVHLGRYDFTRFTHLGHRRLFRQFDEIDSGPVAGPGTVLAWSYEHLLLSSVSTRAPRPLVKAFARLTGSWLKFLDVLSAGHPAAFDAASAYYFLGRKSDDTLEDRELVTLYRGSG